MKQDKKLIYGIGINDADYITRHIIDGKEKWCPYYMKWVNMLKRCYSDNYQAKRPTYIGCSVATEWHSFMAFRNWMEKQDWQGKELDKDILNPNNKVYSPDNCIFVTHAINSLFTDRKAKRGDYPMGVYYDKSRQKYQAQIRINGKANHLGRYKTVEEAEQAYLTARAEYVSQHIEQNKYNIKLVVGLNKHLKLIKDKIKA